MCNPIELPKVQKSHVEAAGIAAVGVAGLAAFYPPALLFLAGAGLASYASYKLVGKRPKKNITKIQEVLEALNYGGAKNGNLPIQVNKKKSDTHLVYELKAGMCPDDFKNLQPRLNSHLQAETEIYAENGQMHVKVMAEKLPKSRKYNAGLQPPEDMIIPIPIGYSRAGFIWADLVELPHLVIAGYVGSGKTNALHQIIPALTRTKKAQVKLYIIDLKKVEFGYMRDHAEIAMALPDALRIFETLALEMVYRMDLLLKARKNNIKLVKDLPYIVLFIDELSQLSPSLAKDSVTKNMRNMAHQYLTDIICLARALGIHVILSTQRPDKDILPGQLKANIPAALCFQVKNSKNSEIVLDHGRASNLPPIAGRAIWQFDVEREVQVQHLPVELAKKLLPKEPTSKPVYSEPVADGKV